MRRNKYGFSMIELMIYAFLVVVILGIVFRMAILNRRQIEKPASSFKIQQDFLAAQAMLQRDLQETNLSTIRIYPNDSCPDEPPGLSLASARSIIDDTIQTTQLGGLYWQKIIYYTLQPDPNRPGVGRLIRKEGQIPALPSAKPVASDLRPSTASFDPRRIRTVANCIMLKHEKVPQLGLNLKEQGGFEVFFMDAEGNKSLTDSQHHNIVVVNLTAKEVSPSTGQPTVMTYQIRVYPRH